MGKLLLLKVKIKTVEPFVLASQKTQVYFVRGLKDSTWCI